MNLSQTKHYLHEQSFFQKLNAALSGAVDKVTTKSSGGLSRVMGITQALQQVVNDAVGRGLQVERPLWSRPFQGFYVPMTPDGKVPTTVDQFVSDPRWKGALAAWMMRAKSAGYDVSFKMIGGKPSLFIDPKTDKEILLGHYRQHGQDVSRNVKDQADKAEMDAGELRANMVNHRIQPWDLDDEDLNKLFPKIEKSKALENLYGELFASKPFGKTMSGEMLSSYIREAKNIPPGLWDILATNVDLNVAKEAANTEGIDSAEVASAADSKAVFDLIVGRINDRSTIDDPTARKGLSDIDLLGKLKKGQVTVDQLDKEDRIKVLKALGVIRIPTDVKKHADLIKDLVKHTQVSRAGDSEILDAVNRGSYKGEQAVAALVAQLGPSVGLKRAQAIIKLAGEVPVSANPVALGKQLTSIGRKYRLAPPPPPPVIPGKKAPKTPLGPLPHWVPQVQIELNKFLPSWKSAVEAARASSKKKPLKDSVFKQIIDQKLREFAQNAKRPPTGTGGFMQAARSIVAEADKALTMMP